MSPHTIDFVQEDSSRTGDLFQDLLGDFGGNLVLGQGVRVSERVICRPQLAFLTGSHARLSSIAASCCGLELSINMPSRSCRRTCSNFFGHFG